MIDPSVDRRAPISPQLALRVAVLGIVAFALFAVVFFRLWYLQVLSGDQYLKQAQTNRVRLHREPSPRGPIVDRDGNTLVENRQAIVVRLKPGALPAAERKAASRWGHLNAARVARKKGHKGEPIAFPPVPTPGLQRLFDDLGHVIGMRPTTIQERVIRGLWLLPYASITVKTDVDAAVRNFVKERQERFPGVDVGLVYLRHFPYGSQAAQIFGTTSEITPGELGKNHFRSVPQGTVVGQEGLEFQYDRFLRGIDGATRYQVDAQGQFRSASIARRPQPGHQLKLSLDIGLQQEATRAFLRAGGGKPGAFVALDPTTGEVLALGSYPSINPNDLSRPLSQETYDRLFGDDAGKPLFNRAIAGGYPTGSTFKPITAVGALERGVITPATTIVDTGCITIGLDKQERCNAGHTPYGPVDLVRALQVSSDIYFYRVGQWANPLPRQPIQTWARKLGFARPTGIDIPGELAGVVPDKAWRARVAQKEIDYEKRTGKPCCLYSDKREWTVGDNVSLAVGQGDLTATPLQLAVAYSGLVTGTVPRPHLAVEVDDDQGRLVQRFPRGGGRKVDINPAYRAAIMEGLRRAASESGGTSADVFAGWPHDQFPVFGKTGTAQRPPHPDQSWYVAYSYAGSPRTRPIVVAVTIEGGGFGAEAAAPATRLILSKWFGTEAKFVTGKNHTL